MQARNLIEIIGFTSLPTTLIKSLVHNMDKNLFKRNYQLSQQIKKSLHLMKDKLNCNNHYSLHLVPILSYTNFQSLVTHFFKFHYFNLQSRLNSIK